MVQKWLKRASRTAKADMSEVRAVVADLLGRIETGGEDAARACAAKFDQYDGNLILTREEIDTACARVPQTLKDDIRFAHDNVRRFARKQSESLREFSFEPIPGLITGQRLIPCNAAGCYVPGGRYSHIASAIMTVTTARAAGVTHVTAASPPRPGEGVPDSIIYAADCCGADQILAMGGVQAVATMTFGLFGLPKADILVGPGNQFVAEAKRTLYGRVGIDMVAGPTDSLVLADATADARIVASDLVGQAEHGYNSPVWLVTNDETLATKVHDLIPLHINDLPQVNRDNAQAAWHDYGEIILCDSFEAMARTSDEIAPEHLSVHAADLDWWLGRLRCYGSLFLGEQTTVAFGDKASGPNHVLPTSGAARYTGGLSVHKFIKVVTWQRATRDGARPLAEATARISRMEGMEAHARTADIRLQKYFPGVNDDGREEPPARHARQHQS